MTIEISESEHPLVQVFWFLMFLGWVPMLASYAFVLDPIAAGQAGLIPTLTERISLYEQRGWAHPAIGILGLTGLLAAGILLWHRWIRLWPVPVFLILSSWIYLFNAAGAGDWAEISVHVAYALLAFYCAYLFLRHGHLMSAGFVGFVVLLVLDVGLHLVWREGGVLGLVFVDYQPSLMNAFLFLAIAVLVRMVWLMVRDNRQFYASLEKGAFRRALSHSFRLWYPMFLIFLLLGGLWWGVANLWLKPRALTDVQGKTEALENAALGWIIDNVPMSNETRATYIDNWLTDAPEDGDPLEVALIRLNLMQIGFQNERFAKAIAETRAAGGRVEDFPDALRDRMEAGYPEKSLPLLDPPGWCFFLDPVCNVERSLKNSANDMMINTRQGVIDETHQTLTDPAETLGGSVDGVADAARRKLTSLRDGAQATSVTALSGSFRTWRNISLLATLYSLIVLLKTAIIVFSRVVFAPKGATAQFLPDDPSDGAQLERHGQVYTIPRTSAQAFFVARWGVTLEGPPPARRRPLGLRFPIARILSGTWSMNRIEGNRDDVPEEFDAELKVDEPAELVSWSLKPGERVVFQFKDFVGMSDALKVRRITSLGITTLVLGRMIYHAAEGPGVLILRTTAAARTSPSSEANRPAPMQKLVAWGSSTRFAIHAALTKMDTFMSGYNLRISEGDGVVWDSSTRRGDGPGTGILRFIKSFLLPI